MFVKRFLIFCFLFLSICHYSFGEKAYNKKALICGVCKNVVHAMPHNIENAELLGSCFADYRVLIYENNSTDGTNYLLQEWAGKNSRVIVRCENVPPEELPLSRTEKIARARNIVLSMVREHHLTDYEYLIMVDLDFTKPWPVVEIVKTVESSDEWDCVSANGSLWGGYYYDRYAFRSRKWPCGPELLDNAFWESLQHTWFKLKDKKWISVYSAFGGLAIYKTDVILQFSYSGTVTKDLKKYYKKILASVPGSHPQFKKYCEMNGLDKGTKRSELPIIFRPNTGLDRPPDYEPVTCCEHVTLHASMALKGYDKIFVNPKMMIILK